MLCLGRECQPHQLADREKRADSCRSCHFAHEALRESVVAAELCIVVLFAEDALVFFSTSQIVWTATSATEQSGKVGAGPRGERGRGSKTEGCVPKRVLVTRSGRNGSTRSIHNRRSASGMSPRHNRLWSRHTDARYSQHVLSIGVRMVLIARNLWRPYRNKSHEALRQRKHLHQEEMVPQPWYTDHLRVAATKVGACTSTQLNDECRTVEYNASETHESCHDQVQEFAIQAEKAMDA